MLQSWTNLNLLRQIEILSPPPPLPQFNVDKIRQTHVRSIDIISTTLNWGGGGRGQIELYKHHATIMTYDRSCVSTILSTRGKRKTEKKNRKRVPVFYGQQVSFGIFIFMFFRQSDTAIFWS